MPNGNTGFYLSDSMDMLSLNDILPSPSINQRHFDFEEFLDVNTTSPREVNSQPDQDDTNEETSVRTLATKSQSTTKKR